LPARPLVWALDTEEPALDFIPTVFPLLREDERRRVEGMIVALPERAPAELRRAVEHQRSQLLIRLNEADVVTEQAKVLLRELLAANTVAQRGHQGPKFQVTTRAVDEDVYVREILGASADTEVSKDFLNIHRPAKEFAAKQHRSASREDIDAILDSLRELHSVLNRPPKELDPKLLAMACGTLANACRLIADSDNLSYDTSAGQFALAVLLELSTHPSPEHYPADDAGFDEHPCWSAPIARTEAAAGLIAIARHESCCRTEVLDAIDRLLQDEVPEVRFQVAANLTYLYKTAPDHMWALLKSRSHRETSNAVLDTLAHTLNRLAGARPDSAAELTKTIFENVRPGPGAERVRDTCIHTFVGLHVWRDERIAGQFIKELCDEVLEHNHEEGIVLFALRSLLSHGNKDSEANADAVRVRAIRLFNIIVTAASNEVSRLSELPADKTTETDREAFRSVLKLVDSAANELYFASGVFGHKQASEPQVPTALQKRFYEELADTIDRLSKIGYPSTVHHLIEMLAQFLSFDPRRVFLQIAALVESGKRWNYQYESMAAKQITQVVERYIAEYRFLLQEDAECRIALREVLDSFVEAGWPSAQRLSYRLDEIFR